MCSKGTCTGVKKSCDDGNPCTKDSCFKVIGCFNSPTEGASCDDGNACTKADACVAGGTCKGSLLSCDDGNACTKDSCDPKKGCVKEALTAPCTDGDACTKGDVCVQGACKTGAVVKCDDNNPCTDDSCDKVKG
ncbi:MAG TPA: hypothetical protein DCQ06_09975, partial [Myxococcales bacterium]|nr:hypothetical protein [Myxococcales bacterium]